MYAGFLFNEVNVDYIDLSVDDGSVVTEKAPITLQEDCKDTTESNHSIAEILSSLQSLT